MLGSRSKYFFKDPELLAKCRIDLILYLKSQRYSLVKRRVYLRAFDYFCAHPGDFDGATVVKDLHHIPGLDINAMLHDFHYVLYKISRSFYYKILGDWLYAKEMERTGKGWLSWINFSLLKLSGIFNIVYANLLSRGKGMTLQQKILFEKDYQILMQ